MGDELRWELVIDCLGVGGPRKQTDCGDSELNRESGSEVTPGCASTIDNRHQTHVPVPQGFIATGRRVGDGVESHT